MNNQKTNTSEGKEALTGAETEAHQKRLIVLNNHLRNDKFYAIRELHSGISDAMKDYAEKYALLKVAEKEKELLNFPKRSE